jgi:ribonuclease P protein subunit RPR2
MARSRKKNKAVARSIAQERIEYLFSLAKTEFPELKRTFCKSCGSLLVPGNNSRVRLKGNTIIISCLDCGNIKRYPYGKEKSE